MVTVVTLPFCVVHRVFTLISPWVTAPSGFTFSFASSPLPAFLSGFTFTVKSPALRGSFFGVVIDNSVLGHRCAVPGTVFVAAAGAGVGAAVVPACDGAPCGPTWLPRSIGGRFARMIGNDFDVSCDCSVPFEDGEAPVEVVALLSAALNSQPVPVSAEPHRSSAVKRSCYYQRTRLSFPSAFPYCPGLQVHEDPQGGRATA